MRTRLQEGTLVIKCTFWATSSSFFFFDWFPLKSCIAIAITNTTLPPQPPHDWNQRMLDVCQQWQSQLAAKALHAQSGRVHKVIIRGDTLCFSLQPQSDGRSAIAISPAEMEECLNVMREPHVRILRNSRMKCMCCIWVAVDAIRDTTMYIMRFNITKSVYQRVSPMCRHILQLCFLTIESNELLSCG